MKDLVRLAGAWWLPAVVLIGLFAAGVHLTKRIEGCAGVALAVIAGVLAAAGLMLLYQSNVDRVNVGYIRKYVVNMARPEDGKVIAVEGRARVEGEPLRSPFSDQECAAYVYTVTRQVNRAGSDREGRSSEIVARGQHMVPTEISGSTLSLSLGSLPSFEDAMQKLVRDGSWNDGWNRLSETTERSERSPDNPALLAELLGYRQTAVREVHDDYVRGFQIEATDGDDLDAMIEEKTRGMSLDAEQRERLEKMTDLLQSAGTGNLTIQEEVLPVGETHCFIGKYDATARSLDGTKPRVGPNLMVYRGTGREVVDRVGGEVRRWFLAGLIMVLIGGGLLSMPFWPASALQHLPFIAQDRGD